MANTNLDLLLTFPKPGADHYMQDYLDSCQPPQHLEHLNIGNSPTLIPWPIFKTIVAQGGSWIDTIGVKRRPSNVSGHPGVNRIYLEQQEKCKNPTWISCQSPQTLGAPANVGNSPTLIPWPIFNTIVAQGGSWIDIYGAMRRPSNVSGHLGSYLDLPGATGNPQDPHLDFLPVSLNTWSTLPYMEFYPPWTLSFIFSSWWPKGDLGATSTQ
ncbi:hypothetical protein KR074_002451 [Drosophila pseudoananassae]|nr:hypothetical protein KR074_002451 [Drosophila pseudoananassae]